MSAPTSPDGRAADLVTVWWAHRSLASALDDALLSDHERGRIARLRGAADRERSAVARGVLRLAVAAILPDLPADLVIDWERGPVLPSSLETWASVSHSDEAVAIAVSSAGPVGVDVEASRRAHDLAPAVQEAVFTPAERAELAGIPAPGRRAAALRLWTLKEAVLKATGDGLVRAPATIDVIDVAGAARLERFEERDDLVGSVQLFDLAPAIRPFVRREDEAFPAVEPVPTGSAGGYVGSLAVLAPAPVRVVQRDAADLLR